MHQAKSHARYLKSHDPTSLTLLFENLRFLAEGNPPAARVSFEPPANVFDRIFESGCPPLVARITSVRGQRVPEVNRVMVVGSMVAADFPDADIQPLPDADIQPLPLADNIVLGVMPERLLLYKVSQNHLFGQLRTALDQYEIGKDERRTDTGTRCAG